MKKIFYFLILFAFISVVCFSCSFGDSNQILRADTVGVDNLRFNLKTVQQKNGWGYEISVNDKTLIKQSIIPCIGGKYEFATSEDAFRVGKLVMRKLANGSTLPSVTSEELVNLGIIDSKGNLK